MAGPDPDEQARRLAAQERVGGDPTAWFELLYAAAAHGEAEVPWDRGMPHPLLVAWASQRQIHGGGRKAVVVGCGLGHDAEYVADLGFATVAFDIAASAVRAARAQFPGSLVRYLTADLLDLPAAWHGAFDLVVESYTVQALPDPPRRDAIDSVGQLVGPGGTLLVIAMARADDDDPGQGPPWPLTRAEIDAFATAGLRQVRVDDVRETGTARRWLAEFSRPGRAPG